MSEGVPLTRQEARALYVLAQHAASGVALDEDDPAATGLGKLAGYLAGNQPDPHVEVTTKVLAYQDFQEFTGEELVAALGAEAGLMEGPVSVEVQDPMGNVIVDQVVRLHIGRGHDFDSQATYTWLKITGRLEPRRDEPFA